MRGIVVVASVALLFGGCASTYDHVKCNVESTPASAQVWVGLKDKGKKLEQVDSTPCDLLFNEPGKFEVHVKKDGYITVKKLVTVIEKEGKKGPILLTHPPSMKITLDPLEGGPANGGGGAEGPKKNGEKKNGKKDKPYFEDD